VGRHASDVTQIGQIGVDHFVPAIAVLCTIVGFELGRSSLARSSSKRPFPAQERDENQHPPR
jgi:hypothetical protein